MAQQATMSESHRILYRWNPAVSLEQWNGEVRTGKFISLLFLATCFSFSEKTTKSNLKYTKKDNEIQPIKIVLFPDSSHLGFTKLQLFKPQLDTRQDFRLKY